MKIRKTPIVAWHPVLTDHQAFTYEKLSEQAGCSIVVKVIELEDVVRRAQGWSNSRVSGVQKELIPARFFLLHGINSLIQNRNHIHVFGSTFQSYRLMLLLWLATSIGIKCYMVSEPYSPVAFGYLADRPAWREQLKVKLRPYFYRWYILALRQRLEGVFTISRLAAEQYKRAGMQSNRLFPFGYFVPQQTDIGKTHECTSVRVKRPLRLVFVGSLIGIKGLSLLISAVRIAIEAGSNVQLDVYGPGDPESFDFDRDQIRYMGKINFGDTQKHIGSYDLLVLPSHYDGWGVVVNEALCAGVPVLCSDHVGARVLVETYQTGFIFPRGNKQELSNLISGLALNMSVLVKLRLACRVAAREIQPERAAAYMLNVLTTKPADRVSLASPWYGQVLER